MRSTVIDLGSSSFHVLVADVDPVGIRNVLFERKVAVRVSEQPIKRVLAALSELLECVDGSPTLVATGDFRGRPDVVDVLQDNVGVPIEVLSGEREAQLTWTGVSAELAGSHGRLAVIDLGGGSLECAWGTTGVDVAHTWPLGVLRLRGEDVRRRTQLATYAAMEELRTWDPETVVMASGTARALLRLARRLGIVGDGQRHLWRKTFADLARAVASMSNSDLMDHGVDRSRVDTIGIGALALDAVLDQVARPVAYVARSGLREGTLIDLARSSTLASTLPAYDDVLVRRA